MFQITEQDLYEADKKNIVDYYHTIGYRDAKITSDSVWRSSAKRLKINLVVDEGKRYYHRNIEIKGNSLYKEEYIKNVLGVQKGDVYNPDLLQKRLSFSQDGIDKVTIRGMIERMSMLYVENSVRDQVKNSAEVISSVHNERLWDLDFSIQKLWVLILLSILEEEQ